MKRILLFLLTLTTVAQAQVTIPDSTRQTGGTNFSPQFNYNGTNASTAKLQIYNPLSGKYFGFYSAYQQSQLFPTFTYFNTITGTSTLARINGKLDSTRFVNVTLPTLTKKTYTDSVDNVIQSRINAIEGSYFFTKYGTTGWSNDSTYLNANLAGKTFYLIALKKESGGIPAYQVLRSDGLNPDFTINPSGGFTLKTGFKAASDSWYLVQGIGVLPAAGITKAKLDSATTVTNYLSVLKGVANPQNSVSPLSSGTRIDNLYKTPQAGTVQLSAYFQASGTGKIKLFTKNIDGTYNLITETSVSFTEGLNSFVVSASKDQYFGFYSASTSIAGINGASFSSYRIVGDATGINIAPSSTSTFGLQFNYRFFEQAPVIEVAAQNYSDIQNLEDATTVASPLYFGKADLTSSTGPATTAAQVRIAANQMGSSTTPIHPNRIWLNILGAGSFDVRFYEKSASNYILKRSFTLNTATTGIQSFDFADTTMINPTWHYGIRTEGSVRSAALDATPQVSSIWVSTSVDSTIVSGVDSFWDLYYKIDYGMDLPLKSVVASNQVATIYVSKAGNDGTGSGTITAPYKTISKALTSSVGRSSTKIIVGGGNYRETLEDGDFTFENIEIIPNQKAVVKVMGSDSLQSFTKTSGRTNIYQAAFTGSIATWTRAADPIFEDGNSSKLIDSTDRQPLQKGLQYRLPFTPIPAQPFNTNLSTTLANLDANPGHYYYDSANGIIYLHTSGSNNPSTNGFAYEVPVRAANVCPSLTTLTTRPKLKLDRMQFRYLSRGFSGNGYYSIERDRCSIMGVAGGGIVAGGWRDDTSIIKSFMDESAYCDGDGFNGHYNKYSDYASQDAREGAGIATYITPWAHDNLDDGMSHHERHNVVVQGGLFEYNGDRGFVPAQGCNATISDAIARYNGQDPAGESGTGFCVANAVIGNTYGTTLQVFNCLSIGNKINYEVSGESLNTIILSNCVSRNAVTMEFRARNGARMFANNCKYTQSNPAKIKQTLNGATIIVTNDTVLP